MRGKASTQPALFVQRSVEDFVPEDHPLRAVKALADQALRRMSQQLGRAYSKKGRPSVAPEVLLKSQLLMALYSIGSEERFCEQLEYNMLFRWFVGLEIDSTVFTPTTFTKNRKRFLKMSAGKKLFYSVLQHADEMDLLSHEHFSVDGTLIEATASMKSFRPKDRSDDDDDNNSWSDFSGKKRSNATHKSTTDDDARLMRKGLGKEARLSYAMNALTENRNGLIVGIETTIATGRSEREGALRLLDQMKTPRSENASLGADKGYAAQTFAEGLSARDVTPHIALPKDMLTGRRNPCISPTVLATAPYQISQIKRRLVEGVFGWLKHPERLKRSRLRGIEKSNLLADLAATAYNLLRLAKLCPS